MSDSPGKLLQFWQELKRRRVIKVIAMYAATAFIIMEAADIMLPRLGLPDWTVTLIIVLLIAGFPIAIILSWIFDVTPDGIKKTEPEESAPEVTNPVKKPGRGIKISDAVIIILFVVVCILLYPKIFTKDKLNEIRATDGWISVAVMPFENLSGESTNDFWQKGISEYLINDLGSSDEVTVITTQVIQEVLGSSGKVHTTSISPEIAREAAGKINASTYVTGKFLGTATNVSILLNLINTLNGKLVWTCRVEGDLQNHYQDLLGHLADTLRNYLEIRALEDNVSGDLTSAFPNSSEAYRYYINGLNALSASDESTATSSLMRALEIDSTFTFAAFYLAWATNMTVYSFEDMAFWTNRAYEMKDNLPPQYQTWVDLWYAGVKEDTDGIRKACSIMERSDIQSRFYWFDLAVTYHEFLEEYEKAIVAYRKVESLSEHWNNDWELGRYYSEYSAALLETDRLDEMKRIAEKGLKITPDNMDLVISMGARSLLLKDSVAFMYYYNRVREMNNGDVNPEASNAHDIGDIYRRIKDFSTAAGYYRKAYELDPGRNWSHYFMIRMDLQADGNPEKCIELIESELDRNPQNYIFIWLKGYALYKLGRNKDALVMLQEADQKLWYTSTLKRDIQAVEQALNRDE